MVRDCKKAIHKENPFDTLKKVTSLKEAKNSSFEEIDFCLQSIQQSIEQNQGVEIQRDTIKSCDITPAEATFAQRINSTLQKR
jgi:hypothetical protein